MQKFDKNHCADYDLVIVGAGPAGISASCAAKKHGLKFLTLEQDTLGGTVYSFPRAKIVMTAPMDLPLYGKVKLYETSKSELLDLWNEVLQKHEIEIREKTKVEAILPIVDHFKIKTKNGEEFTTHNVLLTIGRRGSPRKLNVPGEELEKVSYRLLEPEHIENKNIIVIGGGDSAVESAMLLADQNKVILSYRGPGFKRIKPKNQERVQAAIDAGILNVQYNSNLVSIHEKDIILKVENGEEKNIANDLVYIFAGGELPTQFLQKVGIEIKKRFQHVLKSHKH
jgi:thioredoxin reductase